MALVKVTSFNKAQHKYVSDCLNHYLKALGAELGVEFAAGGGIVGEGGGEIRVKVNVLKTASGVSGAQAEWNRSCHYYAMTAADFGRVFSSEGVQYRIVGLNMAAPKYPINVERTHDKKPYRMTKQTVVSGLQREDAKKAVAA